MVSLLILKIQKGFALLLLLLWFPFFNLLFSRTDVVSLHPYRVFIRGFFFFLFLFSFLFSFSL